jgi:hypothetical protein
MLEEYILNFSSLFWSGRTFNNKIYHWDTRLYENNDEEKILFYTDYDVLYQPEKPQIKIMKNNFHYVVS